MGQPINELSDTQFRVALLAVLGRIAAALESQHADDDQTITMPLSEYPSFDWGSIGARFLNTDESGPAQVWHDGKVFTRRTNDKFGQDIWFSRGAGKNDDGTPRYHKLIEFRPLKPAEPIGRKTEQALRASQPSQAPTMPQSAVLDRAAIPTTTAPATAPPPQEPPPQEPAGEIALDKAIEMWNEVAGRAQKAGKRDVVQVNSLKHIKDNVAAIVEAARRIENALT